MAGLQGRLAGDRTGHRGHADAYARLGDPIDQYGAPPYVRGDARLGALGTSEGRSRSAQARSFPDYCAGGRVPGLAVYRALPRLYRVASEAWQRRLRLDIFHAHGFSRTAR